MDIRTDRLIPHTMKGQFTMTQNSRSVRILDPECLHEELFRVPDGGQIREFAEKVVSQGCQGRVEPIDTVDVEQG